MENKKSDKWEIIAFGIAVTGIAAALVIARAKADTVSLESGQRLGVARLASALAADLGALVEVLQALAGNT